MNQIQLIIRNNEFWHFFFASIGILGIYFSAVLIGFVRRRDRKRIFLGLYILSISILLIQVSTLIYPIDILIGVLNLVAASSIFFVGPFSYLMFQEQENRMTNHIIKKLLLPVVLSVSLIVIFPDNVFWIYLTGIVHTGFYLVCQGILVFKREKIMPHDHYEHKIVQSKFNKRYTGIQGLVFLAICFTCIICSSIFCYFLASISLTILILLFWISLMQSTYSSY